MAIETWNRAPQIEFINGVEVSAVWCVHCEKMKPLYEVRLGRWGEDVYRVCKTCIVDFITINKEAYE